MQLYTQNKYTDIYIKLVICRNNIVLLALYANKIIAELDKNADIYLLTVLKDSIVINIDNIEDILGKADKILNKTQNLTSNIDCNCFIQDIHLLRNNSVGHIDVKETAKANYSYVIGLENNKVLCNYTEPVINYKNLANCIITYKDIIDLAIKSRIDALEEHIIKHCQLTNTDYIMQYPASFIEAENMIKYQEANNLYNKKFSFVYP